MLKATCLTWVKNLDLIPSTEKSKVKKKKLMALMDKIAHKQRWVTEEERWRL